MQEPTVGRSRKERLGDLRDNLMELLKEGREESWMIMAPEIEMDDAELLIELLNSVISAK
ncbi:MAG: hypothetical protein JW885_02620 [Deltaproteobacteria bacterium]|nr:hypothetical protein [Candidatus Zymogenaceae bacterium]